MKQKDIISPQLLDNTRQIIETAQEEESENQILYSLSIKSQQAHDEHIDAIKIDNDVIEAYRVQGEIDGEEKGMKKGIEIGKKESSIEIARNLKAMGMDVEMIKKATNLTDEELMEISS